ncbi:hypothetical protein [Rhodobacteraceae bacterium DSL-40]|uniref:hypothetical protein n=1 Tax=Amaricoccus sp. B4 TaxID=3368557 RepID=UPI000DAF1BE4
MPKYIHPLAGGIAMLTIATFWLSTVVVELSGSEAAIIAVKTAIPWGLLLLVPALALTGATGNLQARRRRGPLVAAKQARMKVVAANGLLVLVPCALFLAARAVEGRFDAIFYAVQLTELVAGALNLLLLGLNARDGLALRPRRRIGTL